MTETTLAEKITIEGISDEWYNNVIEGNGLDDNEIVDETLQEVTKDVKQFIKDVLEEMILAKNGLDCRDGGYHTIVGLIYFIKQKSGFEE